MNSGLYDTPMLIKLTVCHDPFGWFGPIKEWNSTLNDIRSLPEIQR